ncbi:VOC family protein [candidate division WOR-3 bacterium]|nr:VOC family protein [candidate division WOR-3 bacterium]
MKTDKMIVYFKVDEFEKCSEFAVDTLGFTSFRKSDNCEIFLNESKNAGIGYCRAHGENTSSLGCMVSFCVENVDEWHEKIKKAGFAMTDPQKNEKHGVYHFYGVDPAGNTLEFMKFL